MFFLSHHAHHTQKLTISHNLISTTMCEWRSVYTHSESWMGAPRSVTVPACSRKSGTTNLHSHMYQPAPQTSDTNANPAPWQWTSHTQTLKTKHIKTLGLIGRNHCPKSCRELKSFPYRPENTRSAGDNREKLDFCLFLTCVQSTSLSSKSTASTYSKSWHLIITFDQGGDVHMGRQAAEGEQRRQLQQYQEINSAGLGGAGWGRAGRGRIWRCYT